jgi:hypothetical protein
MQLLAEYYGDRFISTDYCDSDTINVYVNGDAASYMSVYFANKDKQCAQFTFNKMMYLSSYKNNVKSLYCEKTFEVKLNDTGEKPTPISGSLKPNDIDDNSDKDEDEDKEESVPLQSNT